ncbi:hypothetical protein N7491_004877 [Penicillium cf. griseofulvum]|uniref:LEA domain protein n=1 Tax=Penicillium cf. griseofulvum TaxID=2972120 RepID=A0A9W9M603_9EURO|nr:hypothetical protein N7472_007571 [Penicillium cf. griseofulvum]KAJ5434282.1 hypothetical protein N7491_004877 [Penicillium cf. griseofulvum]KAJ5452113.1 hypothetical protein N7445_000296 [Penicillium cf. griseofulvum]
MFKSMSAVRFAPLLRTRGATQTAPSFQAIRSISATAPCNKGPIDVTKETLKKADRTVADAAVKGINTGETGTNLAVPTEKAAHKIKEVVGSGTKQAKEKGGEVKGEAAEYAGKGKGKVNEVLGEAKGAVGAGTQQARAKGEEVKSEAAGYADKGKIKAEEALNEANKKTKY